MYLPCMYTGVYVCVHTEESILFFHHVDLGNHRAISLLQIQNLKTQTLHF